MRRFLYFSIAVLFVSTAPSVARAQNVAPVELVKQAIAAAGGVDALRAVKGLLLKADAQYWEPQQSYVADGEPRFIGDSKLTVTWDGEKSMARSDWDREFKYPFAETRKYSEIVTPMLGAVSTAKGDVPMSNIRFAAYMREFERASPVLLLKALDEPARLLSLPDQMLDGKPLPSIAFADGDANFTILFDRTTKLPAAIRSLDDDQVYGDVEYDLVFSDWKPVDGIKMAYTHLYRVNNVDVGHVTYREIEINPSIPAETFTIRDEGRREAKMPPPGSIPYQWVIRRLFLGRFLDSDAVNFPSPGPGLKLVELAPNVQFVTGGTHNSLIVARKDHIVVFDAPINDWQSRWTIDAAKARYPGKPVKFLVLTHHHNDHTSGARSYVAEGATVIVAAPNKAHYEAVFRTPHTAKPDELQKNPKPANIVEFNEQMVLKDEGGDIQLYKIANPHSDGMLIGHIVNENIVWVTDLYSPLRDKDRSEMFIAFHAGLKRLGIVPARIAGGHGGVVPSSEMEAIMATK
jgi:glyoxylase-like metal-dependent hydrolase (beta-lactamase superfamily II)